MVQQLNIILNATAAEPAWPDLKGRPEGEVILLGNGSKPIQVVILDKGMTSGRPSVGIRLDLPDGKVVIAETTARLFCSCAKAFMAKYPDLFEGDG